MKKFGAIVAPCAALLVVVAFVTSILMPSTSVVANGAKAQPETEKPMAPLPKTAPAPKDNSTTPEKVALGKMLFFDPRLSGDNKMSCATCHRPDKAFGDGLSQAKGAGGKTLKRNTPSLLNVGFYSTLHWDGRVASLEEQALLPIQAADEMNQDLAQLEKKLNAVPGYAKQFQAVFGTKVTRDGIAKALAAFQRTLVTGPSPYDRYLGGEKNALSADAKRGMEIFFGSAGCAECHRGPMLTDEKFYRLGLSRDKGRGLVTGKAEDNYKVRTPSLRNVASTKPYMHDGSKKSLYDVLFYYLRGVPGSGRDGLPLDIDSLQSVPLSEISELTAFLEALSGEEPKIAPPELPLPAADRTDNAYEVRWSGELKNVMMKGDLKGTIDLKALVKLPHVYAVGALAGLHGEVTIADSKASLARVQDDRVKVDEIAEGQACVLVYAQVKHWKELPLPKSTMSLDQLEASVVAAARKEGIDVDRPFPFLVRGKVAEAKYHVLRNPGMLKDPQDLHDKAQVKFTLKDGDVELVGFYSDKHLGVFTCGGNLHVHLRSADRKVSGHLDDVVLGSPMTLSLPVLPGK